MDNDGWIEVGGLPKYDTWDEDANSSFMGKYIKVHNNVGQNKSNLYVFQVDKEGKEMAVWGSTVLDDRFSAIQPGSWVKIEYLGRGPAKNGRQGAKLYKTFVKPANVSAPTTSTAPAAAPAAAPSTPAPTGAVAGASVDTGDDLPF